MFSEPALHHHRPGFLGSQKTRTWVALLGRSCAIAAWHSRPLPLTSDVGSSWPLPFRHGVLPASAPERDSFWRITAFLAPLLSLWASLVAQMVKHSPALESPLDCKEIQPVHSEGDQPWAQQCASAPTPAPEWRRCPSGGLMSTAIYLGPRRPVAAH